MNSLTTNLAQQLAKRGFRTTGILIQTPDRRYWAVDASNEPALRLFELDLEGQTEEPQEHDPIDNTWTLDDISDYLRAIGHNRG